MYTHTLHSHLLSALPYRPDVAYYVSGFGPLEQQVTALVIWIPLQLSAFAIYPSFKVSDHPMLMLFFNVNCTALFSCGKCLVFALVV